MIIGIFGSKPSLSTSFAHTAQTGPDAGDTGRARLGTCSHGRRESVMDRITLPDIWLQEASGWVSEGDARTGSQSQVGGQGEEKEGCSRQRAQPLQKLRREKGGSLRGVGGVGVLAEAGKPDLPSGNGEADGFRGGCALLGLCGALQGQRTSVGSAGGRPGGKEVTRV